MEALYLAVINGIRCSWWEEIPDMSTGGMYCFCHSSNEFVFNGYAEFDYDDNGEPTWVREYICYECDMAEFNADYDAEESKDQDDESDSNDLWDCDEPSTEIDENSIYRFYRDDKTHQFYLKPSPEKLAQKELEVQELAGQLRLLLDE